MEQTAAAASFRIMKKDSLAIGITTAALMVYCTLVTLDVFYGLIALLFLGLHVLMIWMVLSILKSPVSTDLKWEDQFYQDRPDIRRVGH